MKKRNEFIRICLPVLLFIVITIFPFQGFSQTVIASETSSINDSPYSTSIDITAMQLQLFSAPREFTEEAIEQKLLLEIPWHDGKFKSFEVVESPMLAPEFAKAYPDFKTYAIRAIDNQLISGRIFISQFGLFASVFTPTGTVGIRPIDLHNPLIHEIYQGRHPEDMDLEQFGCSFDEDIIPFLPPDKKDDIQGSAESSLSNGGTLKTYNLAIVTTGEFHDGNGGTVAAATAVVTSSVNAIQAIYDKDIAVRFSLLTPMVYTDPNTDPFDPAGPSRTVQAAEAVDDNFALNTYDIGHCFHDSNEPPGGFAGGGVAGLGVVCNDNSSGISGSGYNKAAGWSGSGDNTTNGWHQLASHEFGHMFDATHTWNGSGGSCSNCMGGNQSANTAYEIGSGTTIMSYQGICGAGQNIPASGALDNYFHAASLEQMVDYINDTSPNNGGSCPVTSSTGNIPPVANSNPCSATLTIPTDTPFWLDGTATDADGDNLSICWEQFDEDGAGVCPTHGFIGATAASSSIAPLFRSFPPNSSTSRTFPAIDDIVTGTNSDFDVLPTVGRTLTFRMTVRDNNASGGGMSCSEVTVTVDGTAGPFEVDLPNGGETYSAGGSITVDWDQANTSSFCTDVAILLSIDGGYTYPYTLATGVTNTTETWTGTLPAGVPNVSTARIKVQCDDYSCATFFDISDADFTVTSNCLTESNYICPDAACTFPQGDSGLNLSIDNFFGSGISSFAVDLDSGDPSMDVVTHDVGGTGCFNWGFQSEYEFVQFTVDATGDYTFTHNSGLFSINSIFDDATFDPNDPCPSFIGSNAENLGGGMATSSSSFTVTLTECTTYRLCAYTFGTFQTYTISMSGAGSISSSGAGPGTDYAYTYVAVDTSNDLIDEEDSGSDFTSLAAGSYEIFGAVYKSSGPTPPNNVNPATWIGQTMSAVLNSGDCALFSTNFKPLTITGGSCTINSSGLANVACNNNGTDCDATDDYITFDLDPMGTGIGSSYDVTVSSGTISPTSGNYGAPTTFQLQNGSAGAGNVTVTITDANDSNCTFMDTVTDPGTCSSACGIPGIPTTCTNPLENFAGFTGSGFTTNPAAGELCSNSWTPNGFSDNSYVPCGNNTSGDYARGTTDGMGETTGGIYGFDDGGGDMAIWIQPTGGDFTPGDLTYQLQNTTGATITDLDISYDILVLNDQNRSNAFNFSYSTDGTNFTSVPALDFSSDGTATGLLQTFPQSTTISGLSILNNDFLWIRWEGDDVSGSGSRDEFGLDNITLCPSPCQLLTSGLNNIQCNNNGTPSDPSDDYITFELNPTGINLGTSYTVTGATLTPTGGNYGSPTTFQTDPGTAGAGDLNLTITDDTDAGCTLGETVTDPGTCSPDCEITASGLANVQCNDNGTPGDPTDDYITFDLDPSGNNLGTSYTVTGATLTPSGGNYGSATSFQTDPGTAGAGDLNLTITDDSDGSCTFSETVTDPGSCSPNCNITDAGLTNVQCNDNGTTDDPTDDYITFDLNPTGFNLGTSYTVTGATLTPGGGNYGGITSFQTDPGTAGAGDLNLTIDDDTHGSCSFSFTVIDPGTCSPDCNILSAGLSNVQCNDNGTPTDDSDDYITFDLNPTGNNLGTTYTVLGATLTPTGGNYGGVTSYQTDPGTAGAGDLNLTIRDDNDHACTFPFTVTDPGPCSSTCNLSGTGFSNLMCNNNGTQYDPSDDYFTFDLNPTGVNLSPNGYNVSSSVAITPSSGNYGSATSFQTPAGSAGGGNLTITVTDMDDANCTASSTLVDPTPNPNIVASSDPTTCGGTDGTITIGGLNSGDSYNVIYDLGGTSDIFAGPFTANGSGEITLNNLSEGSYTNIRVQDNGTGCIGGSLSATLNDPMTPTYTVAGTNPTTCNGTDGSFLISGLTPNTTYDVTYDDDGTGIGPLNLTSNGSGEIDITGLDSGSYTNIVVTFATNCSGAPASVTLSDPADPTPNIAGSTDPTTCGGSDGTITLGGLTSGNSYTANYDYNGNGTSQGPLTANGSGEITLTGLAAGNYTNISVTDNGTNCSGGSLSQTLSDPSAPTYALGTLTDPSFCGGSDGSIQLTGLANNTTYDVSYDFNGNGVGPLSLTSDGSGNLLITGLAAGSYTNIIVSLAGCSGTPLSATLNDPNSPSLSETHNDVTCPGGSDGSIDLTVTGGTPGFTYDWDNDGTGDNDDNEDLAGLSAGTYNCTVTDALGCTATISVTINDGTDNTPPTAICQDFTVSLDSNGDASIATADIDNGSSDNCGTVILSLDNDTFDCTNIGGNTVTLTVDDGNGNSDSCTATVTVEDNENPNAVCQNIMVSLDATGDAMIIPQDVDGGSNDNCGIISLSIDDDAFDCNDIGDQPVVLTVDDGNGNTDQCTATVTVKDNMVPMAVCQDITVQLDAVGIATIGTGDIDNGSSDNCGGITLGLSQTLFDCFHLGSNAVTLTVDDDNGNSSSCTGTVTVEDNMAPMAACQDITVQLDGSGNSTITTADIDNGSSDNCPPTLALDIQSFDCSNIGANTVTLTVSDAAGNSSQCTATVTVEDNIAPVLICQNIGVSLDITGNVTITPQMVASAFGDNCGVPTLSLDISTFDCSNVGANPVTVTGTDGSGNSNTCSATVTIIDDSPPIAMCQDVTVQLDGLGIATITQADIENGSTDACGIASYSVSPNLFTCSELGANTVTLSVTDVNGNVGTCTATVTVRDDNNPCCDAPVAVCQNFSIDLDLFGIGVITPSDIDGGSMADCGLQSLTASQTTFTCLDVGANTVTLTVTDVFGNSANCDATVFVGDVIPPVALCQDVSVTLDDIGLGIVLPTEIDNGSNDECGIASLTLNQNSFNCFDVGLNPVILTVQDNSGNISTCVATVGVIASSACLPPDISNEDGPSIDDPCTCRGNGQFDEEVVINSGSNQTWFVVSTTLLDPNTLTPFAAGTPFTEVPQGAGMSQYVLAGVHLSGVGYTLEAESPFWPNQNLTISNTCSYPEPQIEGLDVVICLETMPITLQGGGGVGVEGSGSFTINGDPATEFDPAALGVGTHLVSFTFDAGDPAGLLNPSDIGCTESIFQFVTVVETPDNPVCNDLEHVALDPDCLAFITPDMVLEGDVPCDDDFGVSIEDHQGNAVPNPISGGWIGELLTVTVTHLPTGNSCWGQIIVEDKLKPELTCNNPTIPCTVDIQNAPRPSGTDNCDNNPDEKLLELILIDDDGCDDDIVRYQRTWIAIDDYGNESDPCTDTVMVQRPTSINFPGDREWTCQQYNSNSNVVAPTNSGSGTINGITGTWCLYEFTHSDVTVPGCGETFTIVRTWSVLDWCTGDITTDEQIIKVKDLEAPSISMDAFAVGITDPGSHPEPCSSQGFLEAANVTDNCHDFTVKIYTPIGEAIYVNGSDGSNGGYIPAPGLAVGTYSITYQATDECGNTSEFSVDITVVDDVAPVAICDEITDVTLSSDGLAEISADVLDDGSHDNCCLSHFEIGRMEEGCDYGTEFGSTATLCCEDAANSPVIMVFRVYDCDNNYNDCMVQVIVEDKLKPVLVSCPGPETITCDYYWENIEIGLSLGDNSVLDQFGSPEYQDNCELVVTPTLQVNIDQCGIGTIVRTWNAIDPSGNQANTCTQVISTIHVSDWVVEFPADLTAVCTDEEPEFGEPTLTNETCELIAVSYEDTYFNVVTDACYKISRQWTVINWCVVGDNVDEEVIEVPESQIGLLFPACDLDGDGDCDTRTFRDSWNGSDYPDAGDAGVNGAPDTDIDPDPWDGFITYQQTIKVIDNVAPVFPDGCEVANVCIEDNTCSAIITLPEPGIQDCSIDAQVSVDSDLGSGFGPFTNIALGTYTVTYTAMDQCGNSNACQTTFEVLDCKKPTPYCKNGLIVELMVIDTPMVEVWAEDFNDGSFDNCPGDLALSFSSDTTHKSLIFNCDHVGQQNIELWVTDASGNQDFCSTFVFIQANMGQCPSIDDPIIQGLITTEEAEPIKDVEVNLNSNSGFDDDFVTENDGIFTFNNVPAGGDYSITPIKDINPLNGVSTFDLVLITKHILGVQYLDSPYKIIAADANNSSTVTTFDLVILRKLILFIDDDFANNTSWRFIPKVYEFPNPQNPFEESFPEIINLNNLSTDIDNPDFIGIKTGDVNGNADPILFTKVEDRNFEDALVFTTNDRSLKSGELYKIDFNSKDFDVLGYQFTLNFDVESLELYEINDALATLENYGLTMIDEGVITTSWNGDIEEHSSIVFSISFKAKTDCKLSKVLNINSRYTMAEAYGTNGNLLDVDLAFSGNESVSAFELYQNRPNPFTESTTIGFELPQAAKANLTITDISGKILKVVEGEFVGGYNEIIVKHNEINGSGVLYYQLETPTHIATRKMILLNRKK